MKNKRKLLIIILSTIVFFLTLYICYKLVPLLTSLKEPERQEKFKNYIENMGIFGWLAVLTIQILQIFIAFIPGEIVEILAGILYGALGGLLICLLGVLLGSILIYYLIKLFVNKHLEIYKEKLKTYSFLKNPKKIHIYLFLIILIPGIPKDIFIYLVPFLPIKFSSFLIISIIARIPSILSSTIVGNSLVKGNYLLSIIILAIFATIGILAIISHDKIIGLFKKNSHQELNNTNNTIEN